MMMVSSLALAASLAQAPIVSPPRPPAPPYPTLIAPPPPPPAPPLPNPSAAARQLALAILERVDLFERQAVRTVVNRLQWSGTGACDFSSAECRRIAEEIAARETPGMVAELRDGVGRVLGAHFERTMNPGQIAEAGRFFAGEAGRALVGSFVSVDARTFAAMEPALAALSRRRGDLAAEFARRTRHLPRAVVPSPPAAPPPPPPPPPPNN